MIALMTSTIGNYTGNVNGLFTGRSSAGARSYYRPMDLPKILARIERRLAAVELSADAASKLAGKPDAIRNLARAVKRDDRQGVSTATLNALAPVLKTTSIWLLAEAGPESTEPETEDTQSATMEVADDPARVDLARRPMVRAKYAGKVEAGPYRPIEEFEDDPDRETQWEPRDRDFPSADLFVFDVVGDSMNALQPRPILSGDQVIGVDFESLQGNLVLRDGMVVVVEQTLDGGHHVERSVKQVEIYEDRIEFCPRSHSARYKPIVVPRTIFTDASEEDGRQVRVLAVVRRISNEVPLS